MMVDTNLREHMPTTINIPDTTSTRKRREASGIRFKSITLKGITYDRPREGKEPENCKVAIDSDPDIDYYAALKAYEPVLAELIPSTKDQADIVEVLTGWEWSDRDGEWVQNLSIKAEYYPPTNLVPTKIALGKAHIEAYPADVLELNEKLWDEAYAYIFENKSAQQALDLGV